MRIFNLFNPRYIISFNTRNLYIVLTLCILFLGSSIIALSQEVSNSKIRNNISKKQKAGIEKIVNEYSSLSKNGSFPEIENLITSFTKEMVVNYNKLDEIDDQSGIVDNELNIFRPTTLIEADYNLVKSSIPHIINKQHLSVEKFQFIKSESSQVKVCVQFNNKQFSNALMISNFYLVKNTSKEWKIFYVKLISPNATTCGF